MAGRHGGWIRRILDHHVENPPETSGGQTPWLNGRPADIDSISDQRSKFRNIAIFRKKFRKGLNQNIDQKADIWSKPSKDRNFLRKK